MSEFPVKAYTKIQKIASPSPQTALAFDSEKQRNTRFLNKGLSKPGQITFDVLRRAVQSTHIARICVNVLKQKVSKTKWVIKPIDPKMEKVNDPDLDAKIKRITELFRHPNGHDETFRTLLDKMIEDLLVIDVCTLEKTRYPTGELAELFYVDASTIRPVMDEFGNQDIEIPMTVNGGDQSNSFARGTVILPVSYVQVLNNSQYGGPESGEIVASWQKKDMIRFMMNPQGQFERVGYGLSPVEAVVSVVSNILNADNFNATYFEEGSFPPTIIHIAGQVNQRDIQQYREYFQQEMSGRYHRPAIMAGGNEVSVMNLKDLTNRDMEFMEYMKFMARLLAAAYGLSGQDIGLTEDVGSKNVSETQKDLSEAKGYSSLLHVLKEVFNQEIIWKDFGFEDIEFDWVNDDTESAAESATIHKTHLESGIETINEAREALGKQPYGKWADVPMLLTATGYVPIESTDESEDDDEIVEDTKGQGIDDAAGDDKKEDAKDGSSKVVGGEKKYQDQNKEGDGKETKKGGPTINQFEEESPYKAPVMFGELMNDENEKSRIAGIFKSRDEVAINKEFKSRMYCYHFEDAVRSLVEYTEKNTASYGGICPSKDLRGVRYDVYVKYVKDVSVDINREIEARNRETRKPLEVKKPVVEVPKEEVSDEDMSDDMMDGFARKFLAYVMSKFKKKK